MSLTADDSAKATRHFKAHPPAGGFLSILESPLLLSSMGHHEYGQQRTQGTKRPIPLLCQFTASLQPRGKPLFSQGGRAQAAFNSMPLHTLLLAGNSNE